MMFYGSGLGVQTLDGCSVELYRRLPYLGEIDFLALKLSRGASILELGCGVGRLTNVLLDLGLRVTAIDNSRDMLAHAPDGAELVEASIEKLRLEKFFDAILLASCLINVSLEQTRVAFLRTARNHLEAGGLLFFERQSVAWLNDLAAGWKGSIGDTIVTAEEVVRNADQIEIRLRYEHQGSQWRHEFTHSVLTDEEAELLLQAAGFRHLEWVDQRRRWGVAEAR